MHARLEQNIALGGAALGNTLDLLILDNHNLGSLFDETERRDIIAAGVNTIGDLTSTDVQGRVTWTQTNRLPTPCLDKVTNSYDPPQGTMTLRAGQCLLLAHQDCDPELGQVTEILGFTSARRDEVYIRIWETKLERPLAYKDTLTISTSTLSTGGGSNITRKVSTLFRTEKVNIANITNDLAGKGRRQPRLYRQFLSAREHFTPTAWTPPSTDDSIVAMIRDLVRDIVLNRVKIFTDGSFTQHNGPLQTVLKSPVPSNLPLQLD